MQCTEEKQIAPMESPHEILVEEEVQRSDRVSSASENDTSSPLQPAGTNGSTSAHADGGRLALKRTRSRFADEEDAQNNAQGGKTIVSFSQGDPANPYNWSTGRKAFIIAIGISTVLNSTLGSALPSGSITFIATYFNITKQEQLVLPISVYLIGYVFGPLLFGPLSEAYGRKSIMISTFAIYTLFTLACAVAPNWPALLVFRLIAGISASSPITVVGGMFADVYDDPVTRGRAMAGFMAATGVGPDIAPMITGFISVLSWRWSFWLGFILAVVTLVPVLFLPETYGPVILQRRAQKMRKETGNERIYAPIELEKKGVKQMMTVTLTRPLRMIAFEAIVLSTCIYGFNPGVSGLAFLPIGLGLGISFAIFLYWDMILQRAKKNNAPWSSIEEYRRLPLACLAGPLFVISLFWLGWTADARIHFIVPMLAGIPFGVGFMLIFMAFLNYLTDAYEIFAASAMAAASTCRSLFGALLPLAAKPMYESLGVAWASSLLGFLSLGMAIIPFAFIKYGDRIRANSKFCQYLVEKKRAEAKKHGQSAPRVEEEVAPGEKV
ncbi:MAG: hypothetical protein LQ347_003860 [Umbilicaria vellea]|nr:MAG: hypothetical protein LQ347_003860 [Umbilicaria vellea]